MSTRFFSSIVLALAGLGALGHAQLGSVLRSRKINDAGRGFPGVLRDEDYFGAALAAPGDVDGDGIPDLAVGAPEDDDGGWDRGAVWILFLNRQGEVRALQKISQRQGGFTGALADDGYFGRRLAELGDLDGDGRGELAVLSGVPNRAWILFLAADGTVRRHVEIRHTDPVFVPAAFASDFAYGHVAGMGDVDGDGIPDLALGAPLDDDGPGADLGAVWILNLSADGTPRSAQKISQTAGGFVANLQPEGEFGLVLSPMGDLDGDGRAELLAGSGFRTWVLHLDSHSQVRQTRPMGGAQGYTEPGATVGHGLYYPRMIGDIDGDGAPEVAAGSTLYRPGTARPKGVL